MDSCATVSPSAFEPVPGWVDNLNGPTGLMVGAAKGVIRSIPPTCPVYTITISERRKLTWGEALVMSKRVGYKYPVLMGLWYPDGSVTMNKMKHRMNVFFFQWIPAYLVDFLMWILRKKPLFNQDMDAVESPEDYMTTCITGGRQYILKEGWIHFLERDCK
uniref:Fatty acyl-CoA reductase C-terminal domain-containing protein n=1 Tax=Megaselia scalaris TaxID=36166 RepID=T1GXP4_MEGSC